MFIAPSREIGCSLRRMSRPPSDVARAPKTSDPGFDIEHLHTMGLQLVAGLAKQVNGTLSTHGEAGTEFCLAFDAPRSAAPQMIEPREEGWRT